MIHLIGSKRICESSNNEIECSESISPPVLFYSLASMRYVAYLCETRYTLTSLQLIVVAGKLVSTLASFSIKNQVVTIFTDTLNHFTTRVSHLSGELTITSAVEVSVSDGTFLNIQLGKSEYHS